MNLNAIFRLICWIQEWYYSVKHNVHVSGHDYVLIIKHGKEFLECENCKKTIEF